MDAQQLISIIGSLGFPVAMCIFLIVKFDKTLENLNDRILSLSVRLDTLIDAALDKREDDKK